MGDIHNSIYGSVVLECNHQLHYHCYRELISKDILKCPVCKKFLPVDRDREEIVKSQVQTYKRLIVPKEYAHIAVQV